MPLKKRAKKTVRAKARSYDTSHLGEEPSFEEQPSLEDRNKAKLEAFNWYNYFFSNRDLRKDVLEYVRECMPEEYDDIKTYADVSLSPTVPKYIRMRKNGWLMSPEEQEFVETKLRNAKREQIVEDDKEENQEPKPTKTISIILRELDEIEDGWMYDQWNKDYSIYDRQMVLKEPVASLNAIRTWVESRLSEFTDYGKDYKGQDTGSRVDFLRRCISELDRITASKRARRKRKPRVKSADKLVSKLKYRKESKEYQLASIAPESLIGAKMAWLFNVKTRQLEYYEGNISVKGTTLIGYTAGKCTTLRKPEEFLSVVLSQTPIQIEKAWSLLSTKTRNDPSGRVSENHVILKVKA